MLISARNEQAVIAQLIESIKSQDYPAENLVTFVVADNCTDGTAAAARDGRNSTPMVRLMICRTVSAVMILSFPVRGRCRAVVGERSDTRHVGKGYALNFLLKNAVMILSFPVRGRCRGKTAAPGR